MKVNGKERTFKKGMNLEEFLVLENYDIDKIAIECNGKIVPKDSYKTHLLNDNDSYEVVVFVGGG